MSDISISIENTEQAVAEFINMIQTNIIDAAEASGNAIISIVEHSEGDFINTFKEEVLQEVAVINSIGELLIAMANYIQSASKAFAGVDAQHNTSRVSE